VSGILIAANFQLLKKPSNYTVENVQHHFTDTDYDFDNNKEYNNDGDV